MRFVRLIRRSSLVALVALASCNEATAPARRYAVLDDVGQSDWRSVSVGGDHTCALKTDGRAFCWGSNANGQLGIVHTDTICGTKDNKYRCTGTPQLVSSTLRFTAISAGFRHTCGITTDHAAYCWGANDQLQASDAGGGGPTLMRVPSALPWTQIAAGYSHTCAVRSDGALFCWGSNDRGQLGNGGFLSAGGIVRVPFQSAIAAVSTGQSRTCARTNAGTVFCWGAVWINRENGLEFTRAQATPQTVPGSPSLFSISVGSFTTCGTDRAGLVYCWEANPRGEIGDGTLEGSTFPLRTLSDLPFVQIAAGIVQTCGIVTSGAAYCWGDDSFGQLGVSTSALLERCDDGTLACSTRPVAVIGRQQFKELSTGFGSNTCGVTVRGNLYCWGLGASGQRGDGIITGAVFAPARVLEPQP